MNAHPPVPPPSVASPMRSPRPQIVARQSKSSSVQRRLVNADEEVSAGALPVRPSTVSIAPANHDSSSTPRKLPRENFEYSSSDASDAIQNSSSDHSHRQTAAAAVAAALGRSPLISSNAKLKREIAGGVASSYGEEEQEEEEELTEDGVNSVFGSGGAAGSSSAGVYEDLDDGDSSSNAPPSSLSSFNSHSSSSSSSSSSHIPPGSKVVPMPPAPPIPDNLPPPFNPKKKPGTPHFTMTRKRTAESVSQDPDHESIVVPVEVEEEEEDEDAIGGDFASDDEHDNNHNDAGDGGGGGAQYAEEWRHVREMEKKSSWATSRNMEDERHNREAEKRAMERGHYASTVSADLELQQASSSADAESQAYTDEAILIVSEAQRIAQQLLQQHQTTPRKSMIPRLKISPQQKAAMAAATSVQNMPASAGRQASARLSLLSSPRMKKSPEELLAMEQRRKEREANKGKVKRTGGGFSLK